MLESFIDGKADAFLAFPPDQVESRSYSGSAGPGGAPPSCGVSCFREYSSGSGLGAAKRGTCPDKPGCSAVAPEAVGVFHSIVAILGLEAASDPSVTSSPGNPGRFTPLGDLAVCTPFRAWTN